LEKANVKESQGQEEDKAPKTNASQPSVKGLVSAPKPAFKGKPG
jgi:hypothetical protein